MSEWLQKRDRAIILTAATTGLRACDIIRLKLSDVDWRKGEIRLCQKKTGRTVYVPLVKETGAALTEGIVLDWLKPGPGESNSVIHGRAAFMRGFSAYLKSVGKDAYILPDRFTAGGTVFVPYLQTYMGHRDLEATAYYIHLLPENLIKSAGIDWKGMNHLIPKLM